MTSDQLKQVVDSTFAKLIAATGRHPFFSHAFAIVQNFIDANWAAIYATLPSGAAGRQLVDSLLSSLQTMVAGNPVEAAALAVVKMVVDRYLTQILGN